MATNRFWYNNGKIEAIDSEPGTLHHLVSNFNRGLHVIWRTSGSRIPFFKDQYSVLLELLRLNNINPGYDFDQAFLKGCLISLINRNRIFKGSLAHIIFIQEDHSDTNSSSALYISSEIWHEEKFILNSRGLQIGLMNNHPHPGAWLFPRIGSNHLIYDLWKTEFTQLNIDAAYFTNKNGKIVECDSDSIFVISGNRLYTPSNKMGICPRAIRNKILKLAPSLDLEKVETAQLEPSHLDAADEIFIANDLKGIRWVVGHNETRFYKKYSEMFNDLINRDWALDS